MFGPLAHRRGVFPKGIGRTIKKNPTLSLNFHYHPYGEAATDASKIGLYFTDEEPERELITTTTLNPALMLPAHSTDYGLESYYLFPNDSKIVSMLPHMHQRGKAISYTLTYPDGQTERILDVPNYDFNWQWIYYLEEPKLVPAGTWLTVEGHWDNSADNPNNPDPSVDVLWGDGSNYEMLAGIFDIVAADSKRPKPVKLKQVVSDMLARHDPRESYTVNLGLMPFGLHLPREGKGMFYFPQSTATMSIDLPDLIWEGNDVLINTYFLRGAADSLPVAVAATLGDDGKLSGKMVYGRHLTLEEAKQLGDKGRPITGRRLAPAAPSAGD